MNGLKEKLREQFALFKVGEEKKRIIIHGWEILLAIANDVLDDEGSTQQESVQFMEMLRYIFNKEARLQEEFDAATNQQDN